jgi:phage gp36-like protein
MGRFQTVDEFIMQFGEAEAIQIAGTGHYNSLEGRSVDRALIEAELAFADELIAGYVLAQNPWLAGLSVADVPTLLKGISGDIARYRLRDKESGKGQVSDTVETRYKDALRRLEAIQAGKLTLSRTADNDGSDLEAASSGSTVCISGPAPQSDKLLERY